MKGYHCEKCKVKDPKDRRKWIKTQFHYEQIQGIRLKHEGEDGKYYYNVYCPKCEEYFETKK